MLALEAADIAAFLVQIFLLVEIPLALVLSVSREEDFALRLAASVHWQAVRHAEPYDIAAAEGADKVPAAVGIVDISAAVIAVYAKRSSMPARQAP